MPILDDYLVLPTTVGQSANGTNTDAGTLTGAEIVSVSRGSGFLQTTLTKSSNFVYSLFGLYKTVDTIAQLQALSGAAYPKVKVRGYYSAGDGGGGEFDYSASSTATVDGGVVIYDATNGTGRYLRNMPSTYNNVKYWGAVGDGVTDDTLAIKSAAAYSRTLYFPKPSVAYIISSPLYSATAVPEALHWIGERTRASSLSGVELRYTATTGTAVYWLEPNGSAEKGGVIFENLFFTVVNGATSSSPSNSSWFQFGDTVGTPTDDTTTPNYITFIKFTNCMGVGPGAAASTGRWISAGKTFHLETDSQCYWRGWDRGIFLHGCDNVTLAGRANLNGRSTHIERSGTFGNNAKINISFYGPPVAGGSGEQPYCFYDSAFRSTYNAGDIEIVSNTGMRAGFFLDGYGTRMISTGIVLNNLPMWEIGSSANDIEIISPKTTGAVLSPLTTAATTYDYTNNTGNFYGVTVVHPSNRISSALAGVIRHRLIDGNQNNSLPISRLGNEVITNNGVTQRKYTISPVNFFGVSSGTSFSAIGGMVADTNAYLGTAIQLSTTNLSGFLNNFTIGSGLNNGDTIKVTYRYKMSATPASGTFRYMIAQNNTNLVNGALTTSASTTAYTTQTVSYTITGFTIGDRLGIGAYNAAVTDGTLLSLELITVEVLTTDWNSQVVTASSTLSVTSPRRTIVNSASATTITISSLLPDQPYVITNVGAGIVTINYTSRTGTGTTTTLAQDNSKTFEYNSSLAYCTQE